jgi:hypothetical protein
MNIVAKNQRRSVLVLICVHEMGEAVANSLDCQLLAMLSHVSS